MVISQIMGKSRAVLKTTLLSILAITLVGCAAGPEKKEIEEIPFPAPPDPARFVYENTLVHSGQVVPEEDDSRMRALLTGVGRDVLGFIKPYDVVACGGVIYVSDTVHRRVLSFDFNTQKFFNIGEENPGLLYKPMGINVDSKCRLYVTDRTKKQVSIYSPKGKFITAVGSEDDLAMPSHAAPSMDGKLVFVADTGGTTQPDKFHRIVVYSTETGNIVRTIGTRGGNDGEFNLPKDLEVGPDGNLYVVDSGNFKVQVFSQEGEFIKSFGSLGTGYGQLARPKGLAIDPAGNIYVADASFGNFQIFNTDGELLMFIGSRAERNEPGKYTLPSGLDVDEDGRIYFVDQFFQKVDIFRPVDMQKTDGALGVWYRPKTPKK